MAITKSEVDNVTDMTAVIDGYLTAVNEDERESIPAGEVEEMLIAIRGRLLNLLIDPSK